MERRLIGVVCILCILLAYVAVVDEGSTTDHGSELVASLHKK